MKVALYARVSTSDGRQTTENQFQPLREWVKRMNGVVVAEFVDNASGTKTDRQGLQAMMKAAHRRDFDSIAIWALDRLSRQGIAKMTSYLEEFKRYGIRIISHQEPWLDGSSPINDLLIAIFSWVAAQERERLSSRIKAGLSRTNKKLGRPAVVDIERAQMLRRCGLSYAAIARDQNCSRACVYKTLQRGANETKAKLP